MSGIMLLSNLACTTSHKFKMAPSSAQAPIDYGLRTKNSHLDASLHTVILFKGPGTWKENAYWDEYVFTIRNESDEALTISQIELKGTDGSIHLPGHDPWKLEKQSQDNWSYYQEDIESLAMGSLGTAALAGGAILYSTAATGSLVTGAAVGSGAVAVLPAIVAIELATVQVINNRNKLEVIEEFERRRLDLPATIEPDSYVVGCLFFPQTPEPQQLHFHYHLNQTAQTLDMRLEDSPLSKLHTLPSLR